MKLNTIIQLPDGREGTICYHNLDGIGGVWGRHEYAIDRVPAPDFLLREKAYEARARENHANPYLECVPDDYKVVYVPSSVRPKMGEFDEEENALGSDMARASEGVDFDAA